ncbi:MAG: hypothetical protein N4A64_06620, partial [Marinisporobacter sp.]|nr:hypothetical protein [Marinisporobacter sp.]
MRLKRIISYIIIFTIIVAQVTPVYADDIHQFIKEEGIQNLSQDEELIENDKNPFGNTEDFKIEVIEEEDTGEFDDADIDYDKVIQDSDNQEEIKEIELKKEETPIQIVPILNNKESNVKFNLSESLRSGKGLLFKANRPSLMSAYTSETEKYLNEIATPKAQYNVDIMNSYKDDYEAVEDIDPRTGELTLIHTDYVLPGRNGLDLELKRIYKSGHAHVWNTKARLIGNEIKDEIFSSNFIINNPRDLETYYDKRYNLGIGMRFSFPSLEITNTNSGIFLHSETGKVYQIEKKNNEYVIDGHKLKDISFKEDTTYTSGQTDISSYNSKSRYVLIEKDGKKTYFSSDGRILGIKDRYDNEIKFYYQYFDAHKVKNTVFKRLLISKIIDTVGREVNIQYNSDLNFRPRKLSTGKYSTDLEGKFDVEILLPGNKKIRYSKSGLSMTEEGEVLSTRLMYSLEKLKSTKDGRYKNYAKYVYSWKSKNLGITYSGDTYSKYNTYNLITEVKYARNNRIDKYEYTEGTRKLGDTGKLQYSKVGKKIILQQDLNTSTNKFSYENKKQINYNYSNEPSGYGVSGYKKNDD